MFLRLRNRCGVSLVEMLVAIAVMAVLALSISTLAVAVHTSNGFAQTQAEAVQHARVAIGRIENACQAAYATPDFPGFWTISTTVGGHTFPDALIRLETSERHAGQCRRPSFARELVAYTFDANQPHRLLEITFPHDYQPMPALSQTSLWAAFVAGLPVADMAAAGAAY